MNHRNILSRPMLLRIFCTALILIPIFLVAVAGQSRPRAAVTKLSDPLPEPTAHGKTGAVCSNLSASEDPADSRNFQYLLIGLDRLEDGSPARSDALILCTFSPTDCRLTLTSFLRDLYVEIPGHGKNRLNAAYAYGGRELLVKTMEKNFGVVPDGCIEVDFSRFARIIDLLGGIDLTLRSDEANAINQVAEGSLSEGLQHLEGEQALAYSRIRKLDPDGDFSRTARQRKVLSAVIQQCREVSSVRLLSVVIKALPMITTDLDHGDILSTASDLVPMLQDMTISGQRIPADGSYRFDTIAGMNVILGDMDAARELLAETVLGS